MNQFTSNVGKVFEGIIDKAQSEYFEYNSTLEGIDQYATNALEIYLSSSEIDFLYLKLKDFVIGQWGECDDPQNQFFYQFIKPLNEYKIS